MMFGGQKIHLKKTLYNNWVLSAMSTQNTFDNYSINNNLNNLELILPKMLKTPALKQKLACL